MKKLIALLLVVALVFSVAAFVFADDGKENPSRTEETKHDPDKPKDPDSPKTGNVLVMLIPMILLGLFGVVLSTRKLVMNH